MRRSGTHVIYANTIGVNGLQGTELQFALTPKGSRYRE
jgi:hypothetical protein